MQKPEAVPILLPYLLGGAVVLVGTLGLCWLTLGHLSGPAIGIAVGASTLVESFGVVKFLRRQQAKAAPHPLAALFRKARVQQGPSMQIELCRRSLERLGPGMEPLLAGLRQRQHTPVVRECLNRCNDCNLGRLMATADGVPIEASDGDKLLRDLDELA